MKKTMKQFLFTAIPILLLLAACAPAPVPTVSPVEVANQVATSVALTVASQNLDTAQAQPQVTDTAVPTATQVPTATSVPPLDTPTAITIPTTVSSGGSSSGGSSSGSSGYSCEAINRRPFDNTIYKPGDRIDIKWTIRNNGTKTMIAGLDLKFSNGDKLMPDKLVQLPELKPGDEYQLNFDATAPDTKGNYVMVYVVEGGLCFPYTAVIVEK